MMIVKIVIHIRTATGKRAPLPKVTTSLKTHIAITLGNRKITLDTRNASGGNKTSTTARVSSRCDKQVRWALTGRIKQLAIIITRLFKNGAYTHLIKGTRARK